MIDLRARRDMPKDKLAFRNGELVGTAWQEITPPKLLAAVNEKKTQLLESWRRIKRDRERARRKKGSREYRPSTEDDVSSRSKPVCELISERSALTEKLNSYAPAIDSEASIREQHQGTEDPFARIRRTWVEYCELNGYRPKEANYGR